MCVCVCVCVFICALYIRKENFRTFQGSVSALLRAVFTLLRIYGLSNTAFLSIIANIILTAPPLEPVLSTLHY